MASWKLYGISDQITFATQGLINFILPVNLTDVVLPNNTAGRVWERAELHCHLPDRDVQWLMQMVDLPYVSVIYQDSEYPI